MRAEWGVKDDDVSRLARGLWIDDVIINAAFSLLVSGATANDVAFVPIYTSQRLKCNYETWDDILKDMKDLAKKKLILFPLGNDTFADGEWGPCTHWYMIAYTARDNTCRYFNSLPNGTDVNKKQVQEFCKRILHFIKSASSTSSEPANRTSSECSYESVTCAEQPNGNDCGLYVIMNAASMIEVYQQWDPNDEIFPQHTPEQIESKRRELVAVLNSADQPHPVIGDAPAEPVSTQSIAG